jgi:hypothetical protein
VSDGRPVQSIAPVASSKPGRAIYRTICERGHVDANGQPLEYGREMVPATQGHESYLVGNCPKCFEEVRIRAEWEELVSSVYDKVRAESNSELVADEGSAARISQRAQELELAERTARLEQFLQDEDVYFSKRQANYIATAENEELEQLDALKIEFLREKFVESRKAVPIEANAELQTKLDGDRELRAKSFLASFRDDLIRSRQHG